MSEQFSLCGPYYLELAYEAENPSGPGQIHTAYIDGIASEEAAWAACGRMGPDAIEAVTNEGAPVAIRPARLLQALIGRMALEATGAVAAE